MRFFISRKVEKSQFHMGALLHVRICYIVAPVVLGIFPGVFLGILPGIDFKTPCKNCRSNFGRNPGGILRESLDWGNLYRNFGRNP